MTVIAANYPLYYSTLSFLVFAALLALDFIGNKVKHKAVYVAATAAALLMAAWIVFYHQTPGSVAISYLTLAFVMTAVVFILGFVKLSALDYAVLFACFVCLCRFVGFNAWLFGSALPILYVFISILAVYKIKAGRLHGLLFNAWFATVLTVLEWFAFNILIGRYIRQIAYSFDARIEKIIIWCLAALVLIAFDFALIYMIKRLFRKQFKEINEMGRAYPRIERYFIYNSAVILLLMMTLYFAYGFVSGFNNMPDIAFNLFTAFALAIQLSFLILIYKVTWLKDNLRRKTLEIQSLASYSSNLEKNMNDIRGIKHDIKNIFITMGNFVEQSDNVEMREFFNEKISPFVTGEITKSDLFGKLASIESEQLKAFLHYKISQALERGVAVDLDISQRLSSSSAAVEITDLVRILGILMDNAIEECMNFTNGIITIKLSQNDEMVSYMIKNTVSPERKEKGIRAGISSKDDCRGRGLVIVHGILEKYNCVTLNSYFKEDCFVQILVLARL